MKNKSINFAAIHAKNHVLVSLVAIFMATLALCAKKISYQYPIDCYNETCAMVLGGIKETDNFPFYNTLIFLSMPRTKENYGKVNNSILTVTPDCESVNSSAQLPQTNNSFIPTRIGRQTIGTESNIDGDIQDHSIQSSDSNQGYIAGRDTNNQTVSDITQGNYSPLFATIAPITNCGNITINCPQEIIDAVLQLIRKEAII